MTKTRKVDLLSGFSNRIPKTNKFFFMADLDGINLRKVRKAVIELQDRYSKNKNYIKAIGDVHIIRSSRGHYHLYSFYKFTKKQIILMSFWLLERGLVDPLYVKFSFLRPGKVLRFSKKSGKGAPKYVETIESRLCKRKELINLRNIVLSVLGWSSSQKRITIIKIMKKEVSK